MLRKSAETRAASVGFDGECEHRRDAVWLSASSVVSISMRCRWRVEKTSGCIADAATQEVTS